MKEIKKLLFVNMFLLFGLSTILAQTTHKITLSVDTSQITKETVNQFSSFGQSESISNEEFTTEVALGDIIIWEGISTSSPLDQVVIHSIKYVSGTWFFANDVLDNDGLSKVVGIVSKGEDKDSNKYIVNFKVLGKSSLGTLIIDPKLIIKQ